MKFKKKKILPMEGLEREIMAFFLGQLLTVKGLKSVLDKKGGINGKWLNPDKPLDINARKIIKIFIYKTAMQTDEEIERDVMILVHAIRKFCAKHGIIVKIKK